jgi:GNAT superfamily N-acetyltransferase
LFQPPLRCRDADLDRDRDRDRLLDYHCHTDYVCESPLEPLPPYPEYEATWLRSPQPQEFLAALRQTTRDPRGLVKMLLDEDDTPIGYFWVTFTDTPGYDFHFAEIQDIFVAEHKRRKGLASAILAFIETKTLEASVHVLRSGTGARNTASIRLHERNGFSVYRCEFEKRL